MSQNNRN